MVTYVRDCEYHMAEFTGSPHQIHQMCVWRKSIPLQTNTPGIAHVTTVFGGWNNDFNGGSPRDRLPEPPASPQWHVPRMRTRSRQLATMSVDEEVARRSAPTQTRCWMILVMQETL